jgi:TPR repeat protein
MYRDGLGVPQDSRQAVNWYHKAEEQGDADAQYNLGVMYHEGQGVSQDFRQAMNWYRKAAEQGNASAQNNLGFMYANGQGVPRDIVLAYALVNLAADDGYEPIVESRDLVEKEMTPKQIEAARALLKNWQPGNPLPKSSRADSRYGCSNNK